MNNNTGILETIKKSYSYKLALKSILILLVSAALSALILYFALYREPGATYAESFTSLSELRRQLLNKAVFIYLVTSVFIILGISVITLLYSHRVAGPLHRLEIFARKVATGDLTETVKLRQNDVIHPVADDLNNIVAMYKNVLIRMDETLKELKDSGAAMRDPGAKLAVSELSQKMDEIEDLLSDIKL